MEYRINRIGWIQFYENFKELAVGDTFQYEGDGKIKRED